MLTEIVASYIKENRQQKAAALRAMRKVDKAVARFAAKRWRDGDEIARATTDMWMYGYGAVRISREPFAGGVENSEIVRFPPWKS